jgi:uncharacterized protein (TIGR02646 family)
MIKINKIACPPELTLEKQQELTLKYINTKEAVWQQSFIKNALLKSSHNKCAYCECMLGQESKYLEVEHYHHKDKYPNKVVEWDNLLPSCKRCNGSKGAFDTNLNDFINPSVVEPKEHMILDDYRLRPTSLAGENTIEELNLNDSAKLIVVRYQVSEAVINSLEDIYQSISTYIETPSSRKLNKITSASKSVFKEGLSNAAYAGTVSTVLLKNQTYNLITDFLKLMHQWDEEFQNIHTNLQNNALSTDFDLFHQYFSVKFSQLRS